MTSPLYAAIDLGSNSFHMLIVREVDGAVQTVAKIKRKVRLAAGLGEDNQLDEAAMMRGWQCLSLFAEQLQDISPPNVVIVATATLRQAVNREQFIGKAERILNHPIQVISGDQEAQIIYRGVACTSSGRGQRLVIDIGGASTELIIGEKNRTLLLNSLHMGCVTWLNRHFNLSEPLTKEQFNHAITAAKAILSPYLSSYRRLGWQSCIGASGTIQAVQEIMLAQQLGEPMTLKKLYQLRNQVLACGQLEQLQLNGLSADRTPVFPSGLAILIALFEELKIKQMSLAGGALREGLVYGLLSQQSSSSVRTQTAQSFQKRHRIDAKHAQLVCDYALQLAAQVTPGLDHHERQMLRYSAMFHEVGLNIEFKRAPEHAAYIIDHSDLPGFSLEQKHLISAILLNQRDSWQLIPLKRQRAVTYSRALMLTRILRIAIILSMRRSQHQCLSINLLQQIDNPNHWTLNMPPGWLDDYPLRSAELQLEQQNQPEADLTLEINELIA
ncbi:guanosine-5'-triphosphate,3'-diphosphate diphosphatase [Celerinatantimonas diazotrophica]|uniref:Exopolyphosphatase/guanosine-5'-triphosphate, 3'-diphosphate pyrophosphatase n=1 Tax=Celerinatantimonas diazotrophica TaxID=412034 RepID=A0A4R1KF85_9GAMM|nr:guanosine-5'-triphosphate,3'-diphosphate diphosphatase [Celerinatantimonas diazotrophica]TCK63345.1 exopolyphosphatase/guanosine-5'-triphosphate,3'-diphosphate pyrophosphatase [Celerinatantimonas diazotrophica]CAG9298489.1 Guanosine-5'-triphosphate,3'-diphosphate pyrophosphatase [Celerinatantimonas diazotrophica]